MTYNLLDDPDFVYATDEQFKGYCDLDLTNDERHMAHIVAKYISFCEFKRISLNKCFSETLSDCYDGILETFNNSYYHPNQEQENIL